MYFEGEPLNEKDRWLQSALPGSMDLLIAKLLHHPLTLSRTRPW